MAGAIRNQFNLVGGAVNSGTNSGTEGGATGGGSTGTGSATVQAAVAKDAKDWTLDEQEAVAEDIAAKGEASPLRQGKGRHGCRHEVVNQAHRW